MKIGIAHNYNFSYFPRRKRKEAQSCQSSWAPTSFPLQTMSHPIIYFSHNIKVNLHISTRYSGTQTHWLQTICPPRQHQHSLSQQSKTPQAMKAPQAMKVALSSSILYPSTSQSILIVDYSINLQIIQMVSIEGWARWKTRQPVDSAPL